MEMKNCCFEPAQFFEPGSVVWTVHCGEVIQLDVLAVRFDMVDEPGPNGEKFTLFLTGYRLRHICHSTVDGYFPLDEVYGSREDALAEAKWHSAESISPDEWLVALGSREAYEAGEVPKECELQPCCANIAALRELLHKACRYGGLINRDVMTLSGLVNGHSWDKVRIPALLHILNKFSIHVEGETS